MIKQKYFWAILKLFVALFATHSLAATECPWCDEGKKCKNGQYGFRRAYVPSATINIGSEDAPLNWDAGGFFQQMKLKGEELRKILIETGSLGTKEGGSTDEISSVKARNVASFSFMFLDDRGIPLGAPFFYFRPDSTTENVNKTFFFFSGRRHREYRSTDPYPWDALHKSAVKEEDGVIQEMKTVEEKINDPRLKGFKEILGSHYVASLQNLEKHLRGELKLFLWNICNHIDFFDYLTMRNAPINKKKRRLVKEEVCSSYTNMCVPNTQAIDVSAHSSNPFPHFLPVEDTQAFTHSEQFALYKMRDHLDKFMDACLNKIGDGVANIGKIVILIYTRNTMCARCGHSIIADFCHSGDDFSSKDDTGKNYISHLSLINKKIREKAGDPYKPLCPSLFLTSALHPYESHVSKTDAFERMVRGVFKDGGNVGDATFSLDQQDRVAVFEDSPKLIFHHHMSPLPSFVNYSQEFIHPALSDAPAYNGGNSAGAAAGSVSA